MCMTIDKNQIGNKVRAVKIRKSYENESDRSSKYKMNEMVLIRSININRT